jgi:hypothetical protein
MTKMLFMRIVMVTLSWQDSQKISLIGLDDSAILRREPDSVSLF